MVELTRKFFFFFCVFGSGSLSGPEAEPPEADKWPDQSGVTPLDIAEFRPEENTDEGPQFDTTTEQNVTVLVGRTAHLHCRVRHLGNRTVSRHSATSACGIIPPLPERSGIFHWLNIFKLSNFEGHRFPLATPPTGCHSGGLELAQLLHFALATWAAVE